jgi:hypothetical protein
VTEQPGDLAQRAVEGAEVLDPANRRRG